MYMRIFSRFKIVLIKYIVRYIWISIVFKYIRSGEWLFKNYLICVSKYSRTIATSLHHDIIRKPIWTFRYKNYTRSVPISVNKNCSVYNYNRTIFFFFLEAIWLFCKNPSCLSCFWNVFLLKKNNMLYLWFFFFENYFCHWFFSWRNNK